MDRHLQALGIILIVTGHFLPSQSLIRAFIYSFHGPLFFVLSGYADKSKNSRTGYIFRKYNTLIIPYFKYVLLSMPYYMIYTSELPSGLIAKFIFYVHGYTIWNGPLWFLVTLFQVQILYEFLLKQRSHLWRGIAIMICLVGGWRLYLFGIDKLRYSTYLFGVEKILFLLPFYILGKWLKTIKIVEMLGLAKSLGIVFITLILALYFNVGYQKPISIYGFVLNNYWGLVLTATLGALGVMGICVCIKPGEKLLLLGRNTVFIMGTHYIFTKWWLASLQGRQDAFAVAASILVSMLCIGSYYLIFVYRTKLSNAIRQNYSAL